MLVQISLLLPFLDLVFRSLCLHPPTAPPKIQGRLKDIKPLMTRVCLKHFQNTGLHPLLSAMYLLDSYPTHVANMLSLTWTISDASKPPFIAHPNIQERLVKPFVTPAESTLLSNSSLTP